MPYVYILSTKSGTYYIGSTQDIGERMSHHRGGYTPSTKKMGNPTLVFKQEFQSLAEARRIEQRLKKLKRRDYIERIVRDGYIKITPP